jgi:hypothetical protein
VDISGNLGVSETGLFKKIAMGYPAGHTIPANRVLDISGNVDISGNLVVDGDASFNGVNTFDDVNLKGNVYKQNGAGTLDSPFRRSVFGNTFTTENDGSKWIKIATLPASASPTKDITKDVLTGGDWTNEPMIITAWFRNRCGFKYQYKKEGNSSVAVVPNNYISLFARSAFGGEVDIWVFLDGTGTYATANWNIDTIDAVVYKNPSSQGSPPTAGSLLFSSNNSSYPPNLVSQSGGLAGHAFKAGFGQQGVAPGGTDYAWSQNTVFKPDVVSFDTGGCYNVVSGKFTAKIKGIYAFKFSAYTNETYNQFSRPTLFKNNIQYQTTGGKIGMNGNQVYSFINLEEGDYVTVKSTTNSLYMYSEYTHNQFSGSFICGYI